MVNFTINLQRENCFLKNIKFIQLLVVDLLNQQNKFFLLRMANIEELHLKMKICIHNYIQHFLYTIQIK